MSFSKDAVTGFSLGAIFSAAVIEGGMHILVHYFEPMTNFMTHVAAFVMPGLDMAWALAFPVLDVVGISDLFTTAAGAGIVDSTMVQDIPMLEP